MNNKGNGNLKGEKVQFACGEFPFGLRIGQ